MSLILSNVGKNSPYILSLYARRIAVPSFAGHLKYTTVPLASQPAHQLKGDRGNHVITCRHQSQVCRKWILLCILEICWLSIIRDHRCKEMKIGKRWSSNSLMAVWKYFYRQPDIHFCCWPCQFSLYGQRSKSRVSEICCTDVECYLLSYWHWFSEDLEKLVVVWVPQKLLENISKNVDNYPLCMSHSV